MKHGFKGIDKCSKVILLIEGVKTTTFNSVKTIILSEGKLRSYFPECVILYKYFLKKHDYGNKEVKVEALGMGGGGSDSVEVEVLYYNYME